MHLSIGASHLSADLRATEGEALHRQARPPRHLGEGRPVGLGVFDHQRNLGDVKDAALMAGQSAGDSVREIGAQLIEVALADLLALGL